MSQVNQVNKVMKDLIEKLLLIPICTTLVLGAPAIAYSQDKTSPAKKQKPQESIEEDETKESDKNKDLYFGTEASLNDPKYVEERIKKFWDQCEKLAPASRNATAENDNLDYTWGLFAQTELASGRKVNIPDPRMFQRVVTQTERQKARDLLATHYANYMSHLPPGPFTELVLWMIIEYYHQLDGGNVERAECNNLFLNKTYQKNGPEIREAMRNYSWADAAWTGLWTLTIMGIIVRPSLNLVRNGTIKVLGVQNLYHKIAARTATLTSKVGASFEKEVIKKWTGAKLFERFDNWSGAPTAGLWRKFLRMNVGPVARKNLRLGLRDFILGGAAGKIYAESIEHWGDVKIHPVMKLRYIQAMALKKIAVNAVKLRDNVVLNFIDNRDANGKRTKWPFNSGSSCKQEDVEKEVECYDKIFTDFLNEYQLLKQKVEHIARVAPDFLEDRPVREEGSREYFEKDSGKGPRKLKSFELVSDEDGNEDTNFDYVSIEPLRELLKEVGRLLGYEDDNETTHPDRMAFILQRIYEKRQKAQNEFRAKRALYHRAFQEMALEVTQFRKKLESILERLTEPKMREAFTKEEATGLKEDQTLLYSQIRREITRLFYEFYGEKYTVEDKPRKKRILLRNIGILERYQNLVNEASDVGEQIVLTPFNLLGILEGISDENLRSQLEEIQSRDIEGEFGKSYPILKGATLLDTSIVASEQMLTALMAEFGLNRLRDPLATNDEFVLEPSPSREALLDVFPRIRETVNQGTKDIQEVESSIRQGIIHQLLDLSMEYYKEDESSRQFHAHRELLARISVLKSVMGADKVVAVLGDESDYFKTFIKDSDISQWKKLNELEQAHKKEIENYTKSHAVVKFDPNEKMARELRDNLKKDLSWDQSVIRYAQFRKNQKESSGKKFQDLVNWHGKWTIGASLSEYLNYLKGDSKILGEDGKEDTTRENYIREVSSDPEVVSDIVQLLSSALRHFDYYILKNEELNLSEVTKQLKIIENIIDVFQRYLGSMGLTEETMKQVLEGLSETKGFVLGPEVQPGATDQQLFEAVKKWKRQTLISRYTILKIVSKVSFLSKADLIDLGLAKEDTVIAYPGDRRKFTVEEAIFKAITRVLSPSQASPADNTFVQNAIYALDSINGTSQEVRPLMLKNLVDAITHLLDSPVGFERLVTILKAMDQAEIKAKEDAEAQKQDGNKALKVSLDVQALVGFLEGLQKAYQTRDLHGAFKKYYEDQNAGFLGKTQSTTWGQISVPDSLKPALDGLSLQGPPAPPK